MVTESVINFLKMNLAYCNAGHNISERYYILVHLTY